jgi:hypothetical protein
MLSFGHLYCFCSLGICIQYRQETVRPHDIFHLWLVVPFRGLIYLRLASAVTISRYLIIEEVVLKTKGNLHRLSDGFKDSHRTSYV